MEILSQENNSLQQQLFEKSKSKFPQQIVETQEQIIEKLKEIDDFQQQKITSLPQTVQDLSLKCTQLKNEL